MKLSAGAPRRPVHEIVRVGQDETVILVIILIAFHPWLRGLSWVIGGPGFLRELSIRRHFWIFGPPFGAFFRNFATSHHYGSVSTCRESI